MRQRFLSALVLFAFLPGCGRDESAGKDWANKLKNGNAEERLQAVGKLVKIEGKAAAPVLVDALGDQDNEVAQQARLALIKIGNPALPPLTKALASKDSLVRERSAETMESISPLSDEAVAALLKAMTDANVSVRVHAAMAIAHSDTHSAKAVPVLSAALEDDSEVIRLFAIKALGQMGPTARSALPALQAQLNDTDPDIQRAAQAAVNNIKGSS